MICQSKTSNKRKFFPQQKSRGFTLIELMTVITIIVILVAVSLPAIKSMTQGNAQKQAGNLLTSMLANARGIAISSHNVAGIVVYEDPNAKGQTAIQLIKCSTVDASTGNPKLYFKAADGTAPQMLSSGIKVAIFANSTNILYTGSESTPKARAIVFDDNGQLIIRNTLYRDTTLTDSASAAWNFDTSGTTSAPGFIVYNATELQGASDAGKVALATPTSVANWIEQNAELVMVNAYTGSVIR